MSLSQKIAVSADLTKHREGTLIHTGSKHEELSMTRVEVTINVGKASKWWIQWSAVIAQVYETGG